MSETTSETFYGKYRGIVTDNKDPLMKGRVRAKVPGLHDFDSGWAEPCAPFGGKATGLFALPSTGAGVWIEFEQGNREKPIWSGCWWGSAAEIPPVLLAPPYKKVMIMTEGGNSILMDDTPGVAGITLETSGGQKIVINSMGIEITNGQGASIKITGLQVSINNGALEVT